MAKTQLQDLPLAKTLAAYTAPAAPELVELHPDNAVACFACGHRCLVRDGRVGICKVRFNEEGILKVPTGYVGAIQCDPIEKKPFFHVLPGSNALSFGMLGCDYHCSYCQNWVTSQALRDPEAVSSVMPTSPAQLVALASEHGAKVLASTYNEPLITSEWAVEIFRQAKAQGFRTAYVSNGNGTQEVINYLRPWVDFYKVDLKGFSQEEYRKLGGQLAGVLDTIQRLFQMGFWLEVVTLIVPGFNDSEHELTALTEFLAAISPDIPWHATAFHKNYRMLEPDNTTVRSLLRAAEIGQRSGLHYVYAGNLPGQVGPYEHTFCPGCGTAVVKRLGYKILEVSLTQGACSRCGTKIPGVWT
ncbi:MAG: AmmeMemoRadiSam system radical SAM enzyme [Nitrospirae bacterium]|nr:AmmeMemoRadiSam system radical SAM enzyme [Nitrospirota bacterium]